ncbi:hypothetical protein ACOME3_007197 [Neoechinorhynchus agilis]
MGCIALNPNSHKSIILADIPKTLMNLLCRFQQAKNLNSKPLGGRFVKYVILLTSRVLVYMGQETRLIIGIDISDIEGGCGPLSQPQLDEFCAESEDLLLYSSIVGDQVVSTIWQPIAGISLEKIIDRFLKGLKVVVDKQGNRFYTPSEDCYRHLPYLSSVVHPLIVIRVLRHRLSNVLSQEVYDRRKIRQCQNQSLQVQGTSDLKRRNTVSNNAYSQHLKVRRWTEKKPSIEKYAQSDDERNYSQSQRSNRTKNTLSALFTKHRSTSQPNVGSNLKSLLSRSFGNQKNFIDEYSLLNPFDQNVRRCNSDIPLSKSRKSLFKKAFGCSSHDNPKMSPPVPPRSDSNPCEDFFESQSSLTDLTSLDDSGNVYFQSVKSGKDGQMDDNQSLVEILDFIRFWILKFEDDLKDTMVHEEFSKLVTLLEKLKIVVHPVIPALKKVISDNGGQTNFDSLSYLLHKRNGKTFFEMKRQIESGQIICSADEKATLAAIQLQIHLLCNETSSQLSQDSSSDQLNKFLNELNPRRASSTLLPCLNKHYPFRSVNCFSCFTGLESRRKHLLLLKKWQKICQLSFSDDIQKLKEFYIRVVQSLPAYGATSYTVHELVYADSTAKIPRILILKSDKLYVLHRKKHTIIREQNVSELRKWFFEKYKNYRRRIELILDFNLNSWHLLVDRNDALLSMATYLWEIVNIKEFTSQRSKDMSHIFYSRLEIFDQPTYVGNESIDGDIDDLKSLLMFPEEMAIRLTNIEHKIFLNVKPLQYLRFLTLTRNGASGDSSISSTTGADSTGSVTELLDRYHKVTRFVKRTILSESNFALRRALLLSFLKCASTCWNIGNFNGAMEIVSALRTEQFKLLWVSVPAECTTISKLFDDFSTTERSAKVSLALSKALDIPKCKVVPFFIMFLKDLRNILHDVPSLTLACRGESHKSVEAIAPFYGQHKYFTRVSVGGILNIRKVDLVRIVLKDIEFCHDRLRRTLVMRCCNQNEDCGGHRKSKLSIAESVNSDELGKQQDVIAIRVIGDDGKCTYSTKSQSLKKHEPDMLYCMNTSVYSPIESYRWKHCVSFVPFHYFQDLGALQVMQNGSTFLISDPDSSTASFVTLSLTCDGSTLVWSPVSWRNEKETMASNQDLLFADEKYRQLMLRRFCDRDLKYYSIGSNDGFLNLFFVKHICPSEALPTVNSELMFMGTDVDFTGMTICFGSTVSEQRLVVYVNSIFIRSYFWHLNFYAPKNTSAVWSAGLQKLLRSLHKVYNCLDNRILLLKEYFIGEHFSLPNDEESQLPCGPSPLDAITRFGGKHLFYKNPSMSSKESLWSGSRSTMNSKKSRATFRNKILLERCPESSFSFASESNADIEQCDKRAASFDHTSFMSRIPRKHNNSSGKLKSSSFSSAPEKQSSDNRKVIGDAMSNSKIILQESRLSFLDYVQLFQTFYINCRLDLKDLFSTIPAEVAADCPMVDLANESNRLIVPSDPANRLGTHILLFEDSWGQRFLETVV